ncbi:MAG: hypothetical protein MUC58_12020 [Rhizobiaceae bacterium]|nr:hypothetical protein [Rhizobiaceae bacterium]
MKPAASREEATRIALMMAATAEGELADAIAKLAFWRAARNPDAGQLPRDIGDALAYSAFLDLVLLSGETGMAEPEDGPWAQSIRRAHDS